MVTHLDFSEKRAQIIQIKGRIGRIVVHPLQKEFTLITRVQIHDIEYFDPRVLGDLASSSFDLPSVMVGIEPLDLLYQDLIFECENCNVDIHWIAPEQFRDKSFVKYTRLDKPTDTSLLLDGVPYKAETQLFRVAGGLGSTMPPHEK